MEFQVNSAFNLNESENKDLKKLIGFQDDSVSPRTIDELFGANFSKIRAELTRILKISTEKTFIFIRECKAQAEDKKLFEKMLLRFTKMIKELLALNLNIRGSILGNLETLEFLSDYE